MFTRLGVGLHSKTLYDWALLASDWLAIVYREIQYKHWRCTYRQLDETPLTISNPVTAKPKPATSGSPTSLAEASSVIDAKVVTKAALPTSSTAIQALPRTPP